jgi:outer membrane protein
MAGGKKTTKIVLAFASTWSIFAFSSNVALAADLAPPAPTVSAPESPSRLFVRLGALGLINQSSSQLFAQPVAGALVPGIGFIPIAGVGPELPQPGRGAKYSNFVTLAVEGGYFVTPNWSVDVATGIPLWTTLKITGFSATPPTDGTVLAKLLLTTVPLTVNYHFTQFGAFQPYLGGGIAPSFALSARDEFNTGVSFNSALGVALQGGFDYLFNGNWGVFFDVKKIFVHSEGKATGIDLGPPLGIIPAATAIRTSFQPWLLSSGVTYRF